MVTSRQAVRSFSLHDLFYLPEQVLGMRYTHFLDVPGLCVTYSNTIACILSLVHWLPCSTQSEMIRRQDVDLLSTFVMCFFIF